MPTLIDRITPTMLKRLQARKLTNAQAAEKLGVSETYLSRTVAAVQEKTPGVYRAEREAAHLLSKARKDTRAMLAKQVLKDQITLEQACEQAVCSERTMLRFVALYRRKPSKFARKA